ncbi:MAG: hypothetical protein JWN01_371 [Patescibacteria group bacterium]|nr:hypothetical protein [Patescibacteria group bacterium]
MKFRWLRMTVSVSLLLSFMPVVPAHAALTDCQTETSPHEVSIGSDNGFSFGLHNANDIDIQWVRLTSPGGGYITPESGSASGWNVTVASNTVTYSGGDLPPSYGQAFFAQALASNQVSPPMNWTVEISGNPNGSGALTCSGDMSVAVTSNPSQISISNIRIAALGSNQVTILWDTDIASTSQVNYGLDSSYGKSSALNSNLVTSHSVTLTGLTGNTGYTYQVSSTTPADGGSAVVDNNTFLTAVQPPPPPPPFIINNITNITTGTTPGVVIKATPTEKVPPTVSIATNFSKPFKAPPTITGTAADNDAVARVDYSVDGGRDWLPADKVTSKDGGKTVAYQFTPSALEDDNYSVVVRAIDASKNTADTAPVTMVIDRLAPQLGPLVVSYGPETLTPDGQGIVHLVAGADYRLATSGVGGPISVTLEAAPTAHPTTANTRSFALTQNDESGLWNGLLSFKTGGTYQLVAKSLDGAGNRTSRTIATVAVTPAGHVTDGHGLGAVAGAQLTLYYLEPSTHTWQIWDGAPYGQDNPQTTKADGSYSLMVPEGKYYLRVQANNYHTFISDIFTVDQPLGITSVIPLGAMAHLGPLHLPDLGWGSHPLALSQLKAAAGAAPSLVGADLPDFQLPSTAGGTKRALDLTGRPTVLTILSTWSPDSQSQLPALAAAQANHDVNVVPVFSQEHAQLVSTYLATAGYDLAALIDADGILVPKLQVGPVPQHIFIDRAGRIKKVMVGVLSKDELLNQLGGL